MSGKRLNAEAIGGSPMVLAAMVFMAVAVMAISADTHGMPPGGGAGAMPPGGPGGHGGYGQPLPDQELPVGTITVKVIGKKIADIRAGQSVELVSAGKGVGKRLALLPTDKEGRARFSGIAAGTSVFARVAGGTARSLMFEVPAKGGVRLLLTVATSEALGGKGEKMAAHGAGGPKPSGALKTTEDMASLRLVGGSYVLGELRDEELHCLQVLIVHNASTNTIVRPKGGLRVPLPKFAVEPVIPGDMKKWVTVAEGGGAVMINRAFPPGRTTVRFGYQLPITGSLVDFSQRLPLPSTGSLFTVENVSSAKVFGPSLLRREMRSTGTKQLAVYIFKSIPSGGTLEFTVSGLPFLDQTPRNVTLGLTIALFLWGIFASFGAKKHKAAAARRETLLAELVALEGSVDEADIKKQATLLSELRSLWGA